jgi:hypothetical protein
VIGKKLQAPVFGMTVAIRDPRDNVIGAVSGVVNLAIPNFLDHITDGRYGKTGGYLLVAPQYRQIITATDKSRVMATCRRTRRQSDDRSLYRRFRGPIVYVSSVGTEGTDLGQENSRFRLGHGGDPSDRRSFCPDSRDAAAHAAGGAATDPVGSRRNVVDIGSAACADAFCCQAALPFVGYAAAPATLADSPP